MTDDRNNEGASWERFSEKSGWFDVAPVIVLVFDPEGRIARMNAKAAEILECEPGAAIGKDWFETFVPQDSRNEVRSLFRWILDEKMGEEDVPEHRVITFKGNIIWVKWRNVAIEGPTGEKIGVLSCGEEITDARAAREELRTSEERYRKIVENAGQAIIVAQDNALKFINSRACEFIGLPLEEVIDRPLHEFIAEEDRALVVERYQRRIEGEQISPSYEFRIARTDGTKMWVEISAMLIRWNGAPATLNFMTDITERKRAEGEKAELQSQLLLSQKLEAVGRLAGGVAHDFNNMLSIINSAAVFLLDEIESGTQMYDDVMDIKNASDKGAALTKQLLALSRRQVMEPRIVDPVETLGTLRSMLQRLLGEDVEVVFSSDKDPGLVRVDPGQLEQVMINLAVNARDAMPNGGKLSIEISSVRISEEDAWKIQNIEPGPHTVISVSDTGMGMDRSVIGQIFEPFFTTKTKGSGLGLASVYGIVLQSGGGITVESSPGSGSRFDIYFPRQGQMDSEIRSLLPSVATSDGSETILVVEDEKMVRHVASRSLKRNGYEVLEASNAGEALLIVDSYDGPIHLVLSDVVMPFMLGPDMVPRLLKVRPDMKVVYMSGYMEKEIVKRLEEKAVPFIAKPFNPDELVRLVRSVLDS